jgi:SAM-dependent methyltransferase
MIIIIAPYLVLLSADLSGLIQTAVVTMLAITSISLVGKLFLKNHIIKLLWQVYGFFYDGLNNFYPYQVLVADVKKRVLQHVPKNARVVDLGCGTGNLGKQLIEEGYTDLVVVDASQSMITRTKRKLSKLKGNATVIRSDLLKYLEAQEEEAVDSYILMNSFYATTDQTRILNEIHRSLKPGGTVILTDPDQGGNGSLIRAHLRRSSILRLLEPRLILIWITDNFISALESANQFLFNTQDDLVLLLEQQNFKLLEIGRTYGDEIDNVNVIVVGQVDKKQQHA